MKTASITPIIKDAKGNADDLNNYRPVSQLPIFSKIIERIISPEITHFLINNNILHPHQSAYMPGLSTETAICMINNDILSSRKSTLIMLLDMSAAFDTLNHTILLSRLREIGISGAALEWFTSYIKYRLCNDKVGSSTSTLHFITNGVPQGSVLGPILFNIYIAPIFKFVKNHPKIRFHSFADDLQIYTDAQSPNDSDAHTNLSNCLKDIIEWCNSNSLKLKPGKSQIIFIDPNKKSI